MGQIICLEPSEEPMSSSARHSMEGCAAIVARMIEKYGAEVLAEIEAEEADSKEAEL